MNNDRELLEQAAKAAGYEFKLFINETPIAKSKDGFGFNQNPLTNDGDALRLAVKLGIDIQFFNDGYNAVTTSTYSYEDDVSRKTVESLSCDVPYAATRRAIVRAAAEIGRTM